ncbi:MAG TPA: FHA domain-containing protein [Myxococcales bacterium]
MSVCPACGKENEDVPGSRTRCAGCGSELTAGTAPSISEELAAFALTEEEAAEAAGPLPARATAGKACAACGTVNPAVARFCFECGTAFARPAAAAPPEDAAPEGSAEPFLEEQPPPFTVAVVVEKGHAQGATFTLRHIENSLGALGTSIELGDDLFVAPHAATLAFVDDRLVLRDEGSVNGVYVKLRGPAPLEPGDLFVAGDHLLRYDGAVDLPWGPEGDTPLLGAPRPQGSAFRVVEVLAGGRTGRTCHRSGPSIAVGRSGCEMNFPSDAQLAPRHAEIRIADDGSAQLADPGHGASGVFLRVRPRQHVELSGGDMLRLGDQLLRVEAL